MNTYATLKTEVAQWLNREGFTSLTDKVDTFLGMAQRRIFRECDLHCLEDTATNDTSTLTLPADFLRTKAFYLVNGSQTYEVLGTSLHNVLTQRYQTGRPLYYNVIGTTLTLGPEPDQAYTWYLVYYKSLDLLSDSNTTNWFTVNAPELILFASLVEASLYLKDDARAAVWQARYQELKKSVEQSDLDADKEGGALKVQVK